MFYSICTKLENMLPILVVKKKQSQKHLSVLHIKIVNDYFKLKMKINKNEWNKCMARNYLMAITLHTLCHHSS